MNGNDSQKLVNSRMAFVSKLFLHWHVLYGIKEDVFDGVFTLSHVALPVDCAEQRHLDVSHHDVFEQIAVHEDIVGSRGHEHGLFAGRRAVVAVILPVLMICLEAKYRCQVFAKSHVGSALHVVCIYNLDMPDRRIIFEFNHTIHFAHYPVYSFIDSGPQHILILEQSRSHGKAVITAKDVMHFIRKQHLQESHFTLVLEFDEVIQFRFPL